ncbi:MAG: methyltransferase domain-containing protein [Syntrophales bacterium]|nr:methyltransferase domain-containing protein [Syntrophales bacterium]MDD5233752.1 methyltransferase domain-containing protein [Syntrophales bacterium]MDD5533554.1 methyltransferase domain-containing protein [Syntrophales bacterium]
MEGYPDRKVEKDRENIYSTFSQVDLHRRVAGIVREHSTNRRDIREVALEGIDLSRCREVLDIGCGFGFFTEALAGRVHPEAVVTGLDMIGDYEPMFLESCRKAGFRGRFLSSDTAVIPELGRKVFDLALCSYALYFFPEAIPDVAVSLRANGCFIAITHSTDNMRELVQAVKDALEVLRGRRPERLPIEDITERFSSENGAAVLARSFSGIRSVDYPNKFVFRPDEFYLLKDYFRFKGSLYVSGGEPLEKIMELLPGRISPGSDGGISISKDDRIFICYEPRHGD